MKVLSLVALAALVSLAKPAFADDLTYNDPAMHFQAPAGWLRAPLNPEVATPGDGLVAEFVFPDKRAPRTISIVLAQFTGGLDEFVLTHISSIRQNAEEGEAVLVGRKDKVALTNGMPAVYLDYTITPSGGTATTSCEYLFIDGQRSVVVKYTGFATDVKDADAMAAMASLYGVAFPHRRSDAQ